MSAPSPKGCDGGPVLQLMYTNPTFRSSGVIIMGLSSDFMSQKSNPNLGKGLVAPSLLGKYLIG